MSEIRILDAQTANLIAAGEVVERPANVIKELLENAIDAESTLITTEIEDGGIALIRVSDNGRGMKKDDLALSVRRHATSKIRSGEDLSSIATLGFRGEALAAISSTSQFTLMSKRKEDLLAHQITVMGDTVSAPEECGAPDGTTVIVRDLFFNQPARRKFLKRPQTEAAAILQYLQRLAVSHPEIAFRHSANGEVKLSTPGNNSLEDCVRAVWGNEFFSSLVPVDETIGSIRVYGLTTRPETARNNHSYQSFYINRRYVKSRTMQFALEDAYKSFVKSEKFPGCVLFLDLPLDEVDVNVHPAKLEVRFSDERSVYNTVYSAVRNALSRLSNRLARDEYAKALEQKKVDPAVCLPEIREKTPLKSKISEVPKAFFPPKELPLFSPLPSRGKTPLIPEEERLHPKPVIPETANFYQEDTPICPDVVPCEKSETANAANETPFVSEQLTIEDATVAVKDNPLASKSILRAVVFNAYLIVEGKDCLYLIDKHAAHERILYEDLKKKHTGNAVQYLLEPIPITLDSMQAAAIAEHREELEEAGFLLEEFGENAFVLRALPQEVCDLDAAKLAVLIRETARELSLGGKADGAKSKKFDRTLYSMACKAAVKAGIPSTDADHEWIIQKLREIDSITVCPHGRPVLVAIEKKEIENLFLRS